MCAAKKGLEIQSYIPRRPIHEMKNRILSKHKWCLFFLLPKIYQLLEYTIMMFARKKFSPKKRGGVTALPAPPSPTPMINA